MKSDDIDDDQLDAFLRGEDGLAQQLRALPQPEPSAQLDAAILAQARKDAPVQQRAPAANDPVAGGWRPASLRWRVPAGLAAMLLAGVLTHRTWVETDGMELLDPPAPAPAPAPAPVMTAPQSEPPPQAAPAPPAADAAAVQASAARAQPERKKMNGRTAPVTAAPTPSIAAPPSESALALPAPAMAPPPPAPAPAPATPVRAESAVSSVTVTGSRRSLTTPLQRAAPAAQEADAAAWIGLIEEMLAAGLKRDTLAEWDAFRASYPDYPVDPALVERISALRRQ